MVRPRLLATVVALVVGSVFSNAYALHADELLLITNRNSPDGRKLAERYAGVRHVPDGRILELSLPTGDDITFDQYERNVVPQVRRFLTENNLREKVTCLVTFYGVPLRISRRVDTLEDRKELTELQAEVTKAKPQVESIVIDLEKLAKGLDPSFEAKVGGTSGDDIGRRADGAARVIERQLSKATDLAARDKAYNAMLSIMEKLAGANSVTTYLAQKELADPLLSQADRAKWDKLVAFVGQSKEQLKVLVGQRYEPAARAKARDLAQKQFGLIEYAGVVQGQLEYLRPGDTAASFDNELALLWNDVYPRAAWQTNPLNYGFPPIAHIPVLMTARLDATDVATINRMLADTLRAEQDGLNGRLVVDARGISAGRDAYARFDQRLINLANLMKAHPNPVISLYLDEKNDVLPPNSVENVALYTGWYSVAHYIPGCKFVPGAVAYHVASFEMTSLHAPGLNWVPNLLKDGAAASLGAVAEPYLNAFPMPDDFFPLLMTGKLTLAEAYWRTTPMTSWMIGLVGDPLYNPFAKAPALTPDDLPTPLRNALHEVAAPFPSTKP